LINTGTNFIWNLKCIFDLLKYLHSIHLPFFVRI